ncbi:MAG: TIGR00645 family protein [Pseudomonadota bacterium]
MKAVELLIERLILGSRWILVVFYLGLAAALALYAASFVLKLAKVFMVALTLDENQMILAMLGLIDAALVASLLLMVMISSYENFVSRFDEGKTDLTWLGKLDSGSLKVKVASAIVAISSIHLLQIFLNVDQYTEQQIMWLTIMHMAFVVSAVALGVLDRISGKK